MGEKNMPLFKFREILGRKINRTSELVRADQAFTMQSAWCLRAELCDSSCIVFYPGK